MAIAHVQSAPAGTFGTSTSRAYTFNAQPGVGNLLIIWAAAYNPGGASTISSVTDNVGGNTWNSAIQQVFNTNNRLAIYWCIVTNTAATFTVTVTWSGSCDNNIAGSEYSGVAAAPTVVTNSGTGSSSTPSSGAVSPSGNNVYCGLMGTDGTGTMTVDAWGTQRHEQNEGNTGSGVPMNAADKIGSGSTTATWTMSSSSTWGAVIAAFNEAAGAVSIAFSRNPMAHMLVR